MFGARDAARGQGSAFAPGVQDSAAQSGADGLVAGEAISGFFYLAEDARPLAPTRRLQLIQDGASPAVERCYFLASREQHLLDDPERAVEASLRVLLGKNPIQRSACHALPPRKACAIMPSDSRQKCV